MDDNTGRRERAAAFTILCTVTDVQLFVFMCLFLDSAHVVVYFAYYFVVVGSADCIASA